MSASRALGLLTVFGPLLQLVGCFSLTNHESARLLETGAIELSGEYSSSILANVDSDARHTLHVGGRIAYGLTDRITVGFGYQRITFTAYESVGYNLPKLSLKFPVLRDRIAVVLPVVCMFGADVHPAKSVHIQPTVIFSYQLKKHAEISAYPMLTVFLPSRDMLLTVGLGTQLGRDIADWAICPELSYSFNLRGSEDFFALGLSGKWAVKTPRTYRHRQKGETTRSEETN